MKIKIAIIFLLVISLIGAFQLKANSQSLSTPQTQGGKSKQLLADETTICYTDTSAKIECNNDAVFRKIFFAHHQIITHFTASWRKDRLGNYTHYVVYLNKDDAQLLIKWAKNNL